MQKEIFVETEYKRNLTIEFHCVTETCDGFFEFESDYWDISEDEICECGAEYNVFGDIDDGKVEVKLTKEAIIENGKLVRPIIPAPNQIDLFLNDTYSNLVSKGLRS